jgi:hypothetical protein
VKAAEAQKQAAALARQILETNPAVTRPDIEAAVRAAIQVVATIDGEDAAGAVMADDLVRTIESEFAIWQPDVSALEDEGDGHVEWLVDERSDIQWKFWERYRQFELNSGLPPQVVRRLDTTTDRILGALESPRREGPWDRRGLVVGHVQAGKTGNYIGLICKALDAGYRLVVVLAGVHESLRCQTQARVEEGVLGYDARFGRASADEQAAKHRVGVGAAAGRFLPPVKSYTSRDGDFSAGLARTIGPLTGADPVVLVVKKNKSVLENLIAWCRSGGFRDPDTGHHHVPHTPILVIDDEADNASVNTKALVAEDDEGVSGEADPTTINRLIRELLQLHDKSAYVGYTATPFANIFILDEARHAQYGDDLFPRSFIFRLAPPDNYVGPARVFGLSASDELREGFEALGIVRTVTDDEGFIIDGRRKDSAIGPLPGSLTRAIQSFILAGAARRARGQVKMHNSMLVHVTRFVLVQQLVAEAIEDYIGVLRERVRYGDGPSSLPIRDELRGLWESDFAPTFEGMPVEDRGTALTWASVDAELTEFLERISVYQVNGGARDALQYRDHDDEGLAVIAVGGDKLSRGLTLEGLTTSYYLRTSRMYDTLMQMGRWFGYRPGYLDLCRLYTTSELERWYAHITMANEELNRRFDEMSSQGRTPGDFGLLVRTHPDGLLVTARAKMRHTHGMKLDFSGSCPETTVFDLDAQTHLDNVDAVEELLADAAVLGEPVPHWKRSEGVWLWPRVGGERLAQFLDTFRFSESAYRVNGALMSTFIRMALAHDELSEWKIAVVGRERHGARAEYTIGGQLVGGLARDSRLPLDDINAFSVKSITSAPDELLDLTRSELEDALALTAEKLKSGALKRKRGLGNQPDGISARRVRPRSRGLLLLYPIVPLTPNKPSPDIPGPLFGLAVSFPFTEETPAVDYEVNNVFWKQEVEAR